MKVEKLLNKFCEIIVIEALNLRRQVVFLFLINHSFLFLFYSRHISFTLYFFLQ